MRKSILITFLFLLLSCNTNRDNSYFSCVDGFIKDIKGNNVDKLNRLENKVIKALKKNKYGFSRHYFSGYKIYKYFDIYYIYRCEPAPANRVEYKLFYNPNNDSISVASDQKAYQYYQNIEIKTIGDTRNLLEHILFINGGYIVDDLKQLDSSYKFNLDSLSNLIRFTKPTAIESQEVFKHIFFVFDRPFNGGTIYKFEINVKNLHIQDKFKIKKLYCFKDSWGYQ